MYYLNSRKANIRANEHLGELAASYIESVTVGCSMFQNFQCFCFQVSVDAIFTDALRLHLVQGVHFESFDFSLSLY